MNWSLTKLFAFGKIKYKDGQILFLDQPVVLIPLDFYIEATRNAIQNNDREEIMDLYFDAWKAGAFFTEAISEMYRVKKFEQRFYNAMNIVKLAGFGDYQTFQFEGGVYSQFRILNNLLAKSFFPSKEPVCHILRGFNAGGGAVVHETIINCIETQCTAVNGRFCKHVNGSEKFLKQPKFRKFVKEQLDLDSLIERERKFLKKNNKTFKWFKG